MTHAVAPVAAPRDVHDLYPIHDEDNAPETPLHELVARYLRDALAAYLPQRWVTGDVCMYWEEGNTREYVAPDVLVVDTSPPDPLPPAYLSWQDPPALLVAEIGSKSTFLRDEGPKPAIYAWHLGVTEYVYYHPDRRDLHLFHLREGNYREALPDARGWLHSETLDVWFGVDDAGWLRIYTPEGEPLLTYDEVAARAQQEAEARTEAEARARHEAEERAAVEKRLAELEERIRALGEDPGRA